MDENAPARPDNLADFLVTTGSDCSSSLVVVVFMLSAGGGAAAAPTGTRTTGASTGDVGSNKLSLLGTLVE